jgi:K+/H+ antiporter YhaU regulatory subunit KhtT
VVRVEAPGLVGRTLGDADVRETTDYAVMASERDADVITEVGPRTTVEPGNELIAVGTDDGIRGFERAFC